MHPRQHALNRLEVNSIDKHFRKNIQLLKPSDSMYAIGELISSHCNDYHFNQTRFHIALSKAITAVYIENNPERIKALNKIIPIQLQFNALRSSLCEKESTLNNDQDWQAAVVGFVNTSDSVRKNPLLIQGLCLTNKIIDSHINHPNNIDRSLLEKHAN